MTEAPSARVYWVSRDLGADSIWLHDAEPFLGGPNWYTPMDASGSSICLEHWPALGLLGEPAPGSCWKVDWVRCAFERTSQATGNPGVWFPIVTDVTEVWFPIVTDVTEALKRRSEQP